MCTLIAYCEKIFACLWALDAYVTGTLFCMIRPTSSDCFVFFVCQDILVGLLRLRKCGRNTTCPELMGRCSIVRELHVYGTAVPVHGRDAEKLQHQVIEDRSVFV